MKTAAQSTGGKGEQAAAAHYAKLGYHLLQSNYRTRFGEVDLILKKDGMLVFCEVKTRSAGSLAAPAASVDARKQHKLILAAQSWLQRQRLSDPPMRFDVVEVFAGENGSVDRINIIENAF